MIIMYYTVLFLKTGAHGEHKCKAKHKTKTQSIYTKAHCKAKSKESKPIQNKPIQNKPTQAHMCTNTVHTLIRIYMYAHDTSTHVTNDLQE